MPSYFPGTYIRKAACTSARYNHLVDDLLTPRLLTFRQININDEPASIGIDNKTWKSTYGNWLSAFPFKFRKNGAPFSAASDIDFNYGTFEANPVDVGADGRVRDSVEVTYEFDYFPPGILQSLLDMAVSVVNTGASGPPTNYTIETMPLWWESVVVDLAFALSMERLLQDYTLWRYRLIYAIGPNEVYAGGGDIVSQIETLKRNSEERAAKTLDNEKFKTGNYLARPTVFYYQSVRGMGVSPGAHGIPFVGGRLRGWKPNRYA